MKTCIIYHRFAKFATPFRVSKCDAKRLVEMYPNDYYILQQTKQEETIKEN